jgi:methionyl-tRNA formyltransferase
VAETRFHGEQLRIHRAEVVVRGLANSRGEVVAPGTILGLHDDLLLVACGKDFLGIAELQRAGRRSMSAREFANGLRATGEVFE